VAFVRTTRHNIPEDAILHSHRRENLKYYLTYYTSILETLALKAEHKTGFILNKRLQFPPTRRKFFSVLEFTLQKHSYVPSIRTLQTLTKLAIIMCNASKRYRCHVSMLLHCCACAEGCRSVFIPAARSECFRGFPQSTD
jgi:hypothetical protein